MGYYATRVRSYTEVLNVLRNYATDRPIVSRTNRFDPSSGQSFVGTNDGEIFVYITGAATVGFYRLTCTTAGANGTAQYTLARATTLTGTYTSLQTGVATGSRVTITGQNLDLYIDLTTDAVSSPTADTITFRLIANPLTTAQTWSNVARTNTNELVLSRTINSESVFLGFASSALGTNGHIQLTSFDTHVSTNSLFAQTNNCPTCYVPLTSSAFTMHIFVTSRSIKVIFDLSDSIQHMYMGLVSTYGSSSQIPTPVCVAGMTRTATHTHTETGTSYFAYWTSAADGRTAGAYIKNANGQWLSLGASTTSTLFPYNTSDTYNSFHDMMFGSINITPVRVEPIILLRTNSGTYTDIYGTFEGVYVYNNASQSSGDNDGNLLLMAEHTRNGATNYAMFDSGI